MSTQGQIWDVAVIGGGIVGLSTALELQSRGRSVIVIDRGNSRDRASFGNAGVINRASILTPASPWGWRKLLRFAANREIAVRIRYPAIPYLARWLGHFLGSCNESSWRKSAKALNALTCVAYEHHQRLAELVGGTTLLRRNGYLKLYREPPLDSISLLEQQILVESGIEARLLDSAALRELEPFIADTFTHALHIPESGSVSSPGRLVELCWDTFRAKGGSATNGEARAIRFSERVATVELNGYQVHASNIVVAAGAWSAGLLAPLGYRVPFAAERGYHVHFKLRAGQTLNRPVADVGGGYAAAPIEEGVRVLTGIEIARPDDPPNDRQLRAVIKTARATLPVEDIVPYSSWKGSRPSTGDGLPVIGRTLRYPALLVAFGHGHIGFSTGPVTGRIIANLLTGQPPQLPIGPFSIERFG